MICEKCGMHDRVTRTVQRKGKTIRLRRCMKCGHMTETEESRVEKPEPPPEPKPTPAKPKKKKAPRTKGALEQALGGAS